MGEARAYHRKAGWYLVPTARSSFRGKPQEGLWGPENIVGELKELEEALKNGEAPKSLVQKLSESFARTESLPDGDLPEGYKEKKRRFYALGIVHNLVDAQGEPIALRVTQEIDTYREIAEARLGILRCDTTQEYSPSTLPLALDHFVMRDPEAAYRLLVDNMETVLNHNGLINHISHATGVPKEKLGPQDVLRYYKLHLAEDTKDSSTSEKRE